MKPLRGIDGITAEWLTDSLRGDGHLGSNGRVAEVAVSDLGVGRGYISQTVRVTPTYEGDPGSAPATVIAKVPSFVNVQERYNRWIGTMVKAEVDWYREAGAECPTRVPFSYGGVHEHRLSYALLLEDLGSLRTVSMHEPLPPDEVLKIAAGVAKVHAKWWEADGLSSASWLPSTKDQVEINTPLAQAGWEIFAERIVPAVDPDFLLVGERIVRDFATLYPRGDAMGGTLIHGDFKSENVLFGEVGTPEEIVFLDWQLTGYGSGPRDIGYFVTQSLDTEPRRQIEEELLVVYYQTLLENGVTGYSMEQCHEGYRLGLMGALVISLIGAQGLADLQPPEENASAEEKQSFSDLVKAAEALVRVGSERNITAIMDTKSGELLGL
ncbi:MAG TPA: oxidoreductase family protein [Dehalococcoidia bacterium]|nr:oxidoreductase family protein [Dehalococcoidia bacterium]